MTDELRGQGVVVTPVRVVFLGTGTPSGFDRCCVAVAVQVGTGPTVSTVLLDTAGGHELLRQLADARITLDSIRQVVVTHDHRDHAAGLPFLLWAVARRVEGGRTGIYAPEEALEALRAATQDAAERLGARLRWHGMTPGQTLGAPIAADPEARLLSTPAAHPVPAMGCVLSVAGRRIAYTGDTTMFDGIARVYEGVDLLIFDAFGLDSRDAAGGWRRAHTTAGDAGRTATDAKAKHLALVHILPKVDPRDWVAAAVAEASASYHGPVIAPDDLAAICV
jgi:ribonuclease BN (tRNA processing enzyme)